LSWCIRFGCISDDILRGGNDVVPSPRRPRGGC
jgi:hypothetical protein